MCDTPSPGLTLGSWVMHLVSSYAVLQPATVCSPQLEGVVMTHFPHRALFFWGLARTFSLDWLTSVGLEMIFTDKNKKTLYWPLFPKGEGTDLFLHSLEFYRVVCFCLLTLCNFRSPATTCFIPLWRYVLASGRRKKPKICILPFQSLFCTEDT